ncbi:MAG: 16S rRNA (uracil(1498)-N(3))-methyltransferase [Burkholderiales bacterium]|nr:MAG: 16S rRNA (uracil(1498)-N(3))-methyltransferase [Burkholderiales bacterium]
MRPRVLIGAAAGESLQGGQLHALDARRSHHLVRVLRLADGAPVECFDGAGARFEARIERADPKACTIRLVTRLDSATESPLRITLVQGISSADRMDWTIEKAVELGVHAIQPLKSAHTQARPDAERTRRRHEHWSRIVEAACMQCGRDRLPVLGHALDFGHWLAAADRSTPRTRLVLASGAPSRLSGLRIDRSLGIELLVGPESGLSAQELASARSAGFEAVQVGPRVLRTETAGLAAIAALQALAGDY